MGKSHQMGDVRLAVAKVKRFFQVVLLGFLFPSLSLASGYQIPNQSLRAVGIAGATVAYTPGPEASYYNPANMGFLEDVWLLETSLTMLHLPSISYYDYRSPQFSGASASEMFYLPQIHLASPDSGGLRFGFSLTFPYGLAKQWEQPYPAASAEKFSLDLAEANPTISYKLTPDFSIGGGLRLLYGEGEVRNGIPELQRKLDGDDFQLGYNLAATYRPLHPWRLSATYRSEVDLDLEGDADMTAWFNGFPVAGYSGMGKLEVPLPAVLCLATSYTVDNVTFELTWSRTYWSAVESFDFQYQQSFLGTPFDAFDRPLEKNWQDTDAWRFGITWEVSPNWQATFGFAIDETPVRENTLGFELPDSDGYMYSAGLQYSANSHVTVGISYMYYYTTSRSVTGDSVGGMPGIYGRFDDGGAHAVNIGAIFSW